MTTGDRLTEIGIGVGVIIATTNGTCSTKQRFADTQRTMERRFAEAGGATADRIRRRNPAAGPNHQTARTTPRPAPETAVRPVAAQSTATRYPTRPNGRPDHPERPTISVPACSRDENSLSWDESGGGTTTECANRLDRVSYEWHDGYDDRIGEACSGWTCTTSQREESIAKYREWYETLADGKTWYLGAHIGKGTSRDPRHTIRIGFARDEEGHRVIMGFIGLHQRNRQS